MPFDGAVKLTGITVVGGPEGTAPAKLRVSSGTHASCACPAVDIEPLLQVSCDTQLPAHVSHSRRAVRQAKRLPCLPRPHDALQVFINRNDLDFSTVADLPAVQEWELLENADGMVEYPTQ